jgi:hypothetical protein
MEESQYGVLLFHSVQGALAAERILRGASIAHKLITVPRHLSSDCGFCLRFEWKDLDAVEALAKDNLWGVQGVEKL